VVLRTQIGGDLMLEKIIGAELKAFQLTSEVSL